MVRYYGDTVIYPTTHAQAGAQAKTEILQSHAGRAKWLYEYVSGTPVSSSVETSALKTFHTGSPGHDHSGGVMGTPIVRPLFCAILGGPGSSMGSAVTYWRAPSVTVPTGAAGTKYYLFQGSLKHVWIPYSPADGAHTLGQISLALFADSPTCTFTTYAAYGNGSIQTSESNTTAAPGTDSFSLDLDNKVQLNPGRFNTIMLDVWVEPPASGTSYVELLSVSINQYQTTP